MIFCHKSLKRKLIQWANVTWQRQWHVHCKTSLTYKAWSLRSFLTVSNTALIPLRLVLSQRPEMTTAQRARYHRGQVGARSSTQQAEAAAKYPMERGVTLENTITGTSYQNQATGAVTSGSLTCSTMNEPTLIFQKFDSSGVNLQQSQELILWNSENYKWAPQITVLKSYLCGFRWSCVDGIISGWTGPRGPKIYFSFLLTGAWR